MIADKLQLPDSVLERAARLYRTALVLRLTQARQQDHVAASLLYLAAREQHLPVLLIDFADMLGESVKALARNTIVFKKELKIQLTLDPPTRFLARFTDSLWEALENGEFNI